MDEMRNDKEKPKVSILMCVYNEEKWVRVAIESILKQTFTDFKFIIVNDGSKDSTLDVLREYEKKDSRIKVINQNNTGLTKALNNGIKYCSGKYIARMDADNEAMPERLEKQVEFLEKYSKYSLVGSWRKDIFEDSTSRVLKLPVRDDEIKRGLMRACVISHSSVMIRSDVLRKYKYNDKFRTSQDYELWMRLGNSHKMYNLPEVLSHAHHRTTSITRTKSKLRAMKLDMKIKFKGYKHLKRPIWEIVYILKPIVEFTIPSHMIEKYVNWKMKKK